MDMHNVKKRLYAAPTTKLIQVETESAICGGSVDITATPGVDTDAQVVNETFGNNNDFTTGENNSWDQ